MSDKLKNFIKAHRHELNSFEPSDKVWANISDKIPNIGGSALKSLNWVKLSLLSTVILLPVAYLLLSEPLSNHKTTAHKQAISNTSEPEQNDIIIPVKDKEMVQDNYSASKTSSNIIYKDDKIDSIIEDVKTTDIQQVVMLPDKKVFSEDQGYPRQENNVSSYPSMSVKANSRPDSSKHDSSILNIDTAFAGIKMIEIEGSFSDINITSHKNNEVLLKGELKSEAKGLKFNYRADYKMSYVQTDSVLKISLSCPKKKGVFIAGTKEFSAKLNLHIPEGTGMSVNNTSGNINISNLHGKLLQVKTNFGDIKAENIGSEIHFATNSGDITTKNITGNMNSESNFGDQQHENIKGDLTIRSNSGDVTIKEFEGNINAKSTFGKITYKNILGNLISSSASGDIKIDHLTGEVKIKTSFGNIKGTDIRLISNSEFGSSSGDIYINLLNEPEELSFDLQSSSGDLTIEKNNIKQSNEKKLSWGKGPITVKGSSAFGDQVYR